MGCSISETFFHSPVDLALGVLFRRGLSLIVQFFTLAQTHIYLYPAALEIDRQRDQRITVLLDLAQKAHDLPPVHQQPTDTTGIRIKPVAMVIGRYVHLVQKQLAILDAAPGILQIQRTLAYGLNFRTAQFNARFQLFFYKIFVVSFPVPGHDLDTLLFRTPHLLIPWLL